MSNSSDTSPESSEVDQLGSGETLVYPGSSIASSDCNVALIHLFQRHNLTYACQNDIMQFLTVLLPAPSNLPRSSYSMTKMFSDLKKECHIDHFCGSCMSPRPRGQPCSKEECSRESEPDAILYRLPLADQIRERIQGNY